MEPAIIYSDITYKAELIPPSNRIRGEIIHLRQLT